MGVYDIIKKSKGTCIVHNKPSFYSGSCDDLMQTNNFETPLKHFCNTFDTLLK